MTCEKARPFRRRVSTTCVEITAQFVLNRRVVLHAIDATPARWRLVKKVDRFALFPELGVHDHAVLGIDVELPLVSIGIPADRQVPSADRFAVARAHVGAEGLVGGVRVRPPQEHLRVRDIQVDVRQLFVVVVVGVEGLALYLGEDGH